MTPDLYSAGRDRIKERLDKDTFRITLASTMVAVIAALAATWTGYEAHQARIEDERPFLAVDFSRDPKVPEQWTLVDQLHFYDTHLVSTGRSPARKVQFLCGMIPLFPTEGNPKWPLQGLDARLFTSLSYILPGHTQQVSCQQVPNFANPTLPYDAIDVLVRIGQVKYQDQHGIAYCTPFCVVIHKRGSDPIQADPCPGDLASYGLCNLK